MTSYIISSKSLEKAKDHAITLAKKEKVGDFDQSFFEFEKDLGIEDIRNIQKTIFLAPFKGEKKAVFIILQKRAGIESQNSMLKLLEEPPQNTLIFIISKDSNFFLPTILSRVKLIEINQERTLDYETLSQVLGLSSVGDKLFLSQQLSKDKDDAIVFLENAILTAREKMIEKAGTPEAIKLRNLIHELEVAHYDLKNYQMFHHEFL